ncbi:peptide-N(4)-(N-acetyl-beta-glucosaminyl)asparagine amidase-like isoform X2 [Alnus glutinosa]|uniref:peptide-N(4)-(N-acetyl-beta- glucosaminyl)asparagine amidase-like isoform X2 n=1 Tax=Alnus glutinosa TaxID=3517 RepID=UPI002D77D2C9|nr:peptide-N(4)-(N-acetyl-beta-glucosaminyl)asparagine amidase-like isoform X2 [Alnus glutinosa]
MNKLFDLVGCWIMYKVEGNKMHELVAYELMSTNDAPERDPMDWVVEGSNDGGSSWHLLDKQTSQIFEDRFQRRAFKVTSVEVFGGSRYSIDFTAPSW